jgi:hypothetical protein
MRADGASSAARRPTTCARVGRVTLLGLAIIGLLTLIFAALAFSFSPDIVDRAAYKAFANTLPPGDVELTQTAFAPTLSGTEVGVLSARGEGLNCSINPPVLFLAFRDGGSEEASVNLRYRQACVSHDLCYRHGAATYGYSQSDCDAFLVRDAFHLCKQIPGNDAGIDKCVAVARRVYAGVVLGGAESFRRADPALPESADIAAALERTSTFAEYQAYLGGQAAIAAPRLMRNAKGAIELVYIKHRPGGEAYRRLAWNGGSFAQIADGFLPSRYDRVPSLPLLIAGQRNRIGDILTWWRRDQTDGNATGGTFELATGEGLGELATITPQRASGDKPDPTATIMLPVRGASGDGLLHFIGIATMSGNKRCGGDGGQSANAIKIVHMAVDPRDALQPAKVPTLQCMTYTMKSPVFDRHAGAVDFDTRQIDAYRYLAIPPVAHFVGGRIEVNLFRRGDAIGRGGAPGLGFTDILLSSTVFMPRDVADRGEAALASTDRCWNLPETAEPFLAIAGGDGHLARLTGVNVQTGYPRIWSAIPIALDHGGCRFSPKASLYKVPSLQGWTQLRMPAFGLSGRNAEGLPTVLGFLAVRLMPVVNGRRPPPKSDPTYDIEIGIAAVQDHDGGISVAKSLPGRLGINITGSEALRRIAHLVPMVADVNGDDVPDLVIADAQIGLRSTAYFGYRRVDGLQGFRKVTGKQIQSP